MSSNLIVDSGGNATSINANLNQLYENRDIVTAVAFEKYNLGPHSTLVENPLYNVAPILRSFGLETW